MRAFFSTQAATTNTEAEADELATVRLQVAALTDPGNGFLCGLEDGEAADESMAPEQKLREQICQQVSACYKHQAHRLINHFFASLDDLGIFQSLSRRVLDLSRHQFGSNMAEPGGELDIQALEGALWNASRFSAEMARSLLESQLDRLEMKSAHAVNFSALLAYAQRGSETNGSLPASANDKSAKLPVLLNTAA